MTNNYVYLEICKIFSKTLMFSAKYKLLSGNKVQYI